MGEAYRPALPPKPGYVERDGEYFATKQTKVTENLARQMELVSVLFRKEAEKNDYEFTSEMINANIHLFPNWDENFTGEANSIVQVRLHLYKALVDIDSENNIYPALDSTLWEEITDDSLQRNCRKKRREIEKGEFLEGLMEGLGVISEDYEV